MDLSQDENSVSAKDCSSTEIYDSYQKTCRKLYCSPGKVLHQFSCIPLINKLQNLQYSLAFKVIISYDPNLEGVSLNSVLDNLKMYLEHVLSIGASGVYVTVTQSHFYVQKPCHLFSQFTSSSEDEALVSRRYSVMVFT
ncbi:uncharacterized protein LOC125668833 [Ostrea edulis]|uniref:uncharacterized protein LOC125668833 n=1 Tax=Ostrea edulis TaxID=37623 RepID=UPI0024AEE00B|nr:uncharacterized protein LOC125668833 [Ostrea edulis]